MTTAKLKYFGCKNAYLQLVGRQSLKCQGSTQRGKEVETGAGFCREQTPLFSLAVFSAEIPWLDPVTEIMVGDILKVTVMAGLLFSD